MIVVKKDFGISAGILKSFNSLAQIILSGESKNGEGVKQVANSLIKYAQEIEDKTKVLEAVKVIKTVSTEETYKVTSLISIVQRFINSGDYIERQSLKDFVFDTYNIPIQYLITSDTQNNAVPNATKISEIVKPKTTTNRAEPNK